MLPPLKSLYYRTSEKSENIMAKYFNAYIYDIDSTESIALSVDSISDPYTTGEQICIGDTDTPEWEVKKAIWHNGDQIVLVKQFVIDNI